MIAEIHRKISRIGTNLSDRLEDQLTGDVFGALRYIPAEKALLPFLRLAYRLHPEGVARTYFEIDLDGEPGFEFWPWMCSPGVEPDVRISGTHNGCRTIIVLEVKYNSGLSGDDEPTAKLPPEESANQLVREARGLAVEMDGANVRRVLIYLTQDGAYPRDIMDRALTSIAQLGKAAVELYWLCWHDISAVIRAALDSAQQFERAIIGDLLALCSDRKRFRKYSGLQAKQITPCWSFRVSTKMPEVSARWGGILSVSLATDG